MNPQKQFNLSIINFVTAVALIGVFVTSITNTNLFTSSVIALIAGLLMSANAIRKWIKYCDLDGRRTRFNRTAILGFVTIFVSILFLGAVVYYISLGEVWAGTAFAISTIVWINLSRILFKDVVKSDW